MKICTTAIRTQDGKSHKQEMRVTIDSLHLMPNGDKEPFFLLRASDAAALAAIMRYKLELEARRPGAEALQRFDKIQKRFALWSVKHGTWPLYKEVPLEMEVGFGDSEETSSDSGRPAAAGNNGSGAGQAGDIAGSGKRSAGDDSAAGAGTGSEAGEYPDGKPRGGKGAGPIRKLAGKKKKRNKA